MTSAEGKGSTLLLTAQPLFKLGHETPEGSGRWSAAGSVEPLFANFDLLTKDWLCLIFSHFCSINLKGTFMRNQLVGLVAVLLVVFLSSARTHAAQNPGAKNAEDLVTLANKKLAKADYDGAIADATEAIRLDPKHSQAYFNRGEAYRLKDDDERAIADYSDAIRLNPKLPLAFSGRGESYRMKGDFSRAIADCTEAIRLDPKAWQAYFNRGEAYLGKSDHDRAIADYSETIRLNPEISLGIFRKERILSALKSDFDRAIADATEAIRLDARIWKPHFTRGEAYRAKGEHDRAITDYSNSNSPETRNSL